MKRVGTDEKGAERKELIRNRLNSRAFLKKLQPDWQGPPTPEKRPTARAVADLSWQHPHCSSRRWQGATWGSEASAGGRKAPREEAWAGSPCCALCRISGGRSERHTPLNVISACSSPPLRLRCCYWPVCLFSSVARPF